MERVFAVAIVVVVVAALVLRPAGADSLPGPSLYVEAQLEPVLTIELSDNAIGFHADRGPGVYDADRAVDVRVATNYGSWTLNCTASPLVGVPGQIPAARLFTGNNNTLSSPDEGAGAGYENMGLEKLVATGTAQPLAVVNTMRFRLKVDWVDRPGQYQGTVSFTYLATP